MLVIIVIALPDAAGIHRIMIFVDAAYLRKGLEDWYGTNLVDYSRLMMMIAKKIRPSRGFHNDLIRIYYYDSASYSGNNDLAHWVEYGRRIRNIAFCDIRRSGAPAGSDTTSINILITVDMLSKAYQDQYDIAILIAGAETLSDTVKAVKDSGKRVYGVVFPAYTPGMLQDSFDHSILLEKEILASEIGLDIHGC